MLNLPALPTVAGAHITVIPPPQLPDLFGLAESTVSGWMIFWGLVHTAASSALVYHGYKRNKSVLWGLVWGLPGGLFWPITLPIAIAQGFGKTKS